MKNIEDSTIIICSIVRNAERGLRKNIPIIETLCTQFNRHKVFVYENDSTDATKAILIEWQERDPENVMISINDSNHDKTIPSPGDVKCNPFYSSKRISKMVSLRNNYMKFIELQGWEADYLMVVDLDVAWLNLEAILSSFKTNVEWDAVTAFGYSLSPKLRKRYHDAYALTEYGDDGNPQTEEKIKDLADKYGKMSANDVWRRVYSAFGGLSIYKFDAIKNLRYLLLPNDDKRVEVRCEHYSIYKQMAERGYNKIYINPAMVLKYQDLSISIIFNFLKRKLGI